MIESIRKVITTTKNKLKTGTGKTISIQRLRKNIDLEYDEMKAALLCLAKIQAIELLNGDPAGKTEHDKIESSQKNIPYINFVWHVSPKEVETMYFEHMLLDKNRQIEDLKKELSDVRQKNESLAVELDKKQTNGSQTKSDKIIDVEKTVPEHVEVDGRRWKIQLKPVSSGKRKYYYFYCHLKLDKKLVYVQVGRDYDEQKAITKIRQKLDKLKI